MSSSVLRWCHGVAEDWPLKSLMMLSCSTIMLAKVQPLQVAGPLLSPAPFFLVYIWRFPLGKSFLKYCSRSSPRQRRLYAPFGAQLINALRVHTPSYGCARATQRATNGIRNLFPLGNAMGQYKRFARALKLVCRSQRNKHSVGLPLVSTRAGRELLLRDFNRWA